MKGYGREYIETRMKDSDKALIWDSYQSLILVSIMADFTNRCILLVCMIINLQY